MRAFHGLAVRRSLEVVAMHAGIPPRPDRAERVARGLLALALLAGVGWALGGHGGMAGLHLPQWWV
jgi:hypothetical protein